MQGAPNERKAPNAVSSTSEFVSTTMKNHKSSDDESKCFSKVQKEFKELVLKHTSITFRVNDV